MTIQTPISDFSADHAPEGGLDIGLLNQLAGSFFAALPGTSTAAAARSPSLSAAPGPVTSLAPATATPSLRPTGGVETLHPHSSQTIALGGFGISPQFAPALPQADFPLNLGGSSTSPRPPTSVGNIGLVNVPNLDLRHLSPSPQGLGQIQSAPSFYFLQNNAPAAVPGAGLSPGVPMAVENARRDFPILNERVNGKRLVWLDNAATTQKPQAVIDRLVEFYKTENSNIHRAAHTLAARATDAYENARNIVARFIGARSSDEIVFVRGATEAINLIAKSWGAQNIGPGDEIIVSLLEHHANIVPWQQLAAEKGAKIRVIPVDETGQLRLDAYHQLLNERTKIVAVTQVSNALGTITPIPEIIAGARSVGAKVLVDGAQSVSHLRVNVAALDADFFVFSGHKIFGPTGIGVVYGKKDLLDSMPPWQGGGNMISDVTFEHTQYHPAPARFEAGTGNIADAVGLGAALEYVEKLGLERIAQYEHALLDYATHALQVIPGVRLIGTAQHKTSVLSFVLAGYKTEDVGKALNEEGIAVRSGHHCAQPILRHFGLESTVRPSLAFYNTCEDVDLLAATVYRLSRQRR